MGPNHLPPHEAHNLDGGAKARRGLTYETIADRVGLVPNLRFWDNVLQGAVCAAFALIGGLAGLALGGGAEGLCVGLFFGLVTGVLLCGSVLLVIGLIRR